MSNLHDEVVGYGKPPKQHRFSKVNQPPRARKKRKSGQFNNLVDHIIAALAEDVSIMKNGKQVNTKGMVVLAKLLVKQGINGTFNQKMSLAKFLYESVGFDPEAMRVEIYEEYEQILADERSKYDEIFEVLRSMYDIFLEVYQRVAFVSNGFLGASSKCSCGSFNEYSDIVSTISEWASEEDSSDPDGLDLPAHKEEECWAPQGFSGSHGSGQMTQPHSDFAVSPPVDDLSAGMIGND